ncbi:alpha/beta hydrolase [Mesorhizobium sp. BAC0120]|uniref:alpha/beta hydrolase n=1 Tax=Mesorhizobium sp. BAC0120 TaxID=3090670 RepID=UPI00298BEE73|nr:alpha/beta hydrolase [Mesorhizobium sp. BAC0120]MDW6022283.1 alpha/beta hydrolase [Mesorhizobium sp. BAC0120]
MAKYRLIALLISALPIAIASNIDPVHARDVSPCASIGHQGNVEKTAKDCVEPRGTKAALGEGQALGLPEGALKKLSVPEPITRVHRFAYRLLRPQNPSGETMILLHGSGGDETSLFKLASSVAPHATLFGVSGRVTQKGIKRWYARITATEFDQNDIRKEAQAFADFLKDRMAAEKLDLNRAVFIGYSNGANLIAAMALLDPNLIHRAVLLRAMPVLHAAPEVDLRRSRFLCVAGQKDKIYAPFAPALEELLRDRGANVDSLTIAAGHLLGKEDVQVVSEWLSAGSAVAARGRQQQ